MGRFTLAYYAITPLFWLLDEVYGANVRAAALQDAPVWRNLYYALCVGCFGAIWLRPGLSSVVALGESSLNLLLLILGVLLPYWRLAEQVSLGEASVSPFTTDLVLNFVIAGSVWLAVFYSRLPAR